jgi:hypothetical protein
MGTERPRSLLCALAAKHPDREVWLQSFWEEKDGIISMDTYKTITLAQYRAYQEQGAPHAIPTMCILTIKPDEMMNPNRAKACIVILGNHEDREWSKKDTYTPVLRPDTMRLIVSIQHGCGATQTLRQDDCKKCILPRHPSSQ